MRRCLRSILSVLVLVAPLAPATAAERKPLKRIVIVYKTHFDIGYTALAKDVVHRYRTSMIDQTLRVVEQYRALPKAEQFAWTIPGWPMEQLLWPGQDAARKSQIEAALRGGNLVVHALPFSVENETAELEDLVRGLHYSADIARRYGFDLPRGAKTTDVPDQVWTLATVLKRGGVKFLHVGVNDATTPAKVPLLFRWEGPDGSRLLTMLTNSYGTWPNPPADWPYSAWLYIHMTYDNQGPPSPQTLQGDLNYFKQKYPGVKVTVGRMSDFYDALDGDDLRRVPLVRADMPDVWVHGFLSSPEGCRTIAENRPLLTATELLGTLNRAWGVRTPRVQAAVAAAYEKSLLWSEHTWGLASQHHVRFKYVKDGPITKAVPEPPAGVQAVEASWQEHIDYARDVRRLLQQPCAGQLAALAARVRIGGRRIVVFNPLPWKRDDAVTVAGRFAPGTVLEADDGAALATEVTEDGLHFVALGVPSLGYRTYRVASGVSPSAAQCTADEARRTIESPAYRLVFDPAAGKVSSLLDKRAGRELLDVSDRRGLAYFYQRFSKQDALTYMHGVLRPQFAHGPHGDMHCRTGIPADQPHCEFIPQGMTLATRVTPLGVEAELKGKLCDAVPQPVTLRFTLYRDLPCLDIAVTSDNQGRVDAWPAACNLSLPLAIDGPQFRVGRVGSIVDPAVAFLENSSRQTFWTNPGVAVFNDRLGVGVTAIDTPLTSLGEPGVMRFDGTFVPARSRVYFNLQNNVWHTNFCDWWSRPIRARFRLWSFAHYDAAGSLLQPGMAAKRPLLAVEADGPAGNLAATQTGLTLSRDGLLVTALGDNPDGPGTLLRVWEQAGTSGQITVTVPGNFTSAVPVNLRGETLGRAIVIRHGSFAFRVEGFAPASFVLQ
jgi:alpha-mannosidase